MASRSSFIPSEESLDLDEFEDSASFTMPLPANDERTTHSNSLSQQEKGKSRIVCIHRSVFLAVLIAVGIFGTVFLYESTVLREESLFASNFESLGVRLTENFFHLFQIQILTSESISASLTSDALYYNKSWPNVLLPDFDLRFLGSRLASNSDFIMFSPLVNDSDRDSWQAFVVENADQVPGLLGENAACPSEECRTLEGEIYLPNLDGTPNMIDPGPGPYFPGFLISASDASTYENTLLVNFYRLEDFQQIFDSILETPYPFISLLNSKDDEPNSFLFFPVLDRFVPPWSVVGAVILCIDWLSSFQSVSPSGGSILAVLALKGEVLSFEIFENHTVFLGEGDYHDPRYDDYVVTDQVFYRDMWNSTMLKNKSSVDLAYSLSVYPTASFEAVYKTNLPGIYAIVASIIFIFIIFLFCIYDRMVEQRQNQTLGDAQRFRNVVHSLFPSIVRGRMFQQETSAVRQLARPVPPVFPKPRSNRRHDQETTTAIVIPPKPRPAMRRWESISRRASNDDIRVAVPATSRLRTFLNQSESQARADMVHYQLEDPIADLFPETTIMFADISGFTAWSSEREPAQVFYLLETLYRAFDKLASRLGVFKVETIGDCYVAVTGLPDPNQDHALVMARFAYECLLKMNDLVKSLEVSLGPGTSDLAIRVGLHSGPVTAGVLRGEKARFQLFGDTMNTASRMESTGTRNRIHVSEDTAVLLRRGGKGHWLTEREGLINAKGKGEMKTWWLRPQRATTAKGSRNGLVVSDKNKCPPQSKLPLFLALPRRSMTTADTWGDLTLGIYGVDADKKARLVNWNVEILAELLSKVIVGRSLRLQAQAKQRRLDNSSHTFDMESEVDEMPSCAFDEVSEVIVFPAFSEYACRRGALVPDASRISDKVKGQLHDFISRIADRYHNVPFHNLEHASHVTLSANKLMKRIIAPGEIEFAQVDEDRRRMRRRRSSGDLMNNFDSIERSHHNSTFGISSDPLCQFAIVFSALIHDVDHCGVTNAQLIKEQAPIAAKYNNRSVAEQNSVDIAWGILMDEKYQDLRSCIFENDAERRRFRQLVVNSVMATDIVDKELKQLRDNRWATAFDESKSLSMSNVDVNRKATIVIEHIIQASDVAHTMQHWHIYSKWNEKLFCEMYTAFLTGRAATDPSEGWYGGEIWFFDNYIIPLAKKLKECGVFGVASDEYLGFALENREEWVIKGKSVVANMLKNFKERHCEEYSHPISTTTNGVERDGQSDVTHATTAILGTLGCDAPLPPSDSSEIHSEEVPSKIDAPSST